MSFVNSPLNAKIKSGYRSTKYATGKTRRKHPKKMTNEELQQAAIDYPERMALLESKKACNGGLGLMPENASELQVLKAHMKIVTELLEKDSKVI